MGQKIAHVKQSTDASYCFKCPGCKSVHQVPTKGPQAWAFNQSLSAPTFHPSILVQGTFPITDDEHQRIMAGEKITPRKLVCHSFVKDGMIQFLGDCTHPFAGKTVPLDDVPDRWKAEGY